MSLQRIFTPKTIAIALIILLISIVGYGYTAANVVPESGAGEGSEAISGYTISNVDYTLLVADPTSVGSVSIDVAATAGASAPNTVQITVDGGTTWITCTGPTGSTWACAFAAGSEPAVADLATLQVVAVE